MDFRQYIGKNILAWLSYNENYEDSYGGVNRVCYVYPRILVKGVNYEPIDPDDFPKYGRIEVRIQGGDSAEDVYSNFGPLVTIKINKDSYPNYDVNNMYSLKYNSQFGKTNSEIWIESFSGRGFYQIIDINSNIGALQNEKAIPEPTCVIRTTIIMLRCGDKLYGPFEYDTKEGVTALRGIKDYQYTVGEYSAVDYNDDLLVIDDQDDEEAIVLIPKSSILSPVECETHFDWISEETLLDNFINFLRTENGYTRDQVRQLKDMAHQLIEANDGVQFTDERISRVQNLIESVAKNEAYARTLIQYALEDEETKDILVKDLAANHFEQIQGRITEVTDVQDRINDLRAEAATLEKHLEELHQVETKAQKCETTAEDQTKIDELTQTIEDLRKEKADLSAKFEVLKEIDELIADRDRLKRERDRARENYNQQLLDNNELKKQFEDTLEEFNSRAKQTARILDNKLLNQILRGVGEDDSEEASQFNTTLLHNPMTYTEIIDRVSTYVRERAHRNVTNNEVANYLICISQGFITTFAGEPGTGKTSLCNIIAKALGLVVDSPQNRFIDISVERGWTSHKDFIGYYNPLTKSMEKSNADVFNAFSRMNNECGSTEFPYNPAEIAPYLILLDEANLSPIEHYWASFLKNCDFASSANRSISLGGNHRFRLPEHLRFLATVNFDHTTEELSPRFLDRSWIITLEPTRIDDEIEEDLENYEDMVSFDSLKTAFCVSEEDVIDESIANKWNAIQSIFRSEQCSLPIMPRNLKMVKNYCAVACKCMDRDTPTTKLAPLDYAFSQKILPTINGTGENYRTLISELLKECTEQNMPISAKHLKRMQRVAENNMGFYQFFAR